MSARKPPILSRGALSGRVYIVTAYTERFDADGNFIGVIANTKHDVTDQFNALVAESVRGTTETKGASE